MSTPATTMPQPGTILIIDQEPALIHVIVEILTDAGYTATVVQDSAAALAAIVVLPPALIVLDIGRYGLRGAALIDQVRVAAAATIPIVVLTTAPQDIAPPRAPGVVECLAKPFTLAALLAYIARYVQPRTTEVAGASRTVGT